MGIGNRDPTETGNTVLGPRPGEKTQNVYVEKQTDLQHEAEKQCRGAPSLLCTLKSK